MDVCCGAGLVYLFTEKQMLAELDCMALSDCMKREW